MRTRSILFLIANALTAGLIIGIAISFITGRHGDDAHVYCQAASAADRGLNPYLVKETENSLAWVYPPVYLKLASLLCSEPINLEVNYPPIYLTLAVISTLLWCSKKEWFFALSLTTTVFLGFLWIIFSGNFAIFEFFLISCAFLFLKKRQWGLAAFLIGLMSSLKIITIFYLVLFLLAPVNNTRRMLNFIYGVLGFFIPLIFSSLVYPNWMIYFILQAMGKIPDQYKVISEPGNIFNPAPAYLLADILHIDPVKSMVPILIIAGLSSLVAMIVLYKKKQPFTDENSLYKIFALGFLVISILLPRVKPYSFIHFSPAIYWLLENKSIQVRNVFRIYAVLLPAFALIINSFEFSANQWYSLILQYSQTISLMAAIAFFYLQLFEESVPLANKIGTPINV